jgi:hypothetical protein
MVVVGMTVVLAVAWLIAVAWAYSGLLLGLGVRRIQLIRTIWAELRPFYLPAIAVLIGQRFADGHIWGWAMVNNAAAILNWFFFKDIDKDDRWRRRGRKVLEKITATDRGLVVVPASDGAS